MGLDFTFNTCKMETAHWSYSGFMHFRERLAFEIGITLNDFQGFGGFNKWKDIKSPLKYFLNHSDCDGQLSAKRCEKLANIIEDIISKWPNDDYDKETAQILIGNMRACFNDNVPLIFC